MSSEKCPVKTDLSLGPLAFFFSVYNECSNKMFLSFSVGYNYACIQTVHIYCP